MPVPSPLCLMHQNPKGSSPSGSSWRKGLNTSENLLVWTLDEMIWWSSYSLLICPMSHPLNLRHYLIQYLPLVSLLIHLQIRGSLFTICEASGSLIQGIWSRGDPSHTLVERRTLIPSVNTHCGLIGPSSAGDCLLRTSDPSDRCHWRG